jgi:glycosyltransferase involved in cell wall biosynthesis
MCLGLVSKVAKPGQLPTLDALKQSRLSVVMPTYNCAPMMERHLEAMALWAYLADEIVVVDSRSTDGTLELIRERLRHPNLRIIVRDRGLYESWNEGIAATTGDWIYVSTAGDTIERDHLLHLLELGQRAEADVVISPPRFVNEDGGSHADLGWPPQEIISRYGDGRPFVLSNVAAACLALIYCPSCLLGSSASNLYRGDALRARPFPADFRGAGDTVWLMRHATALRLCLTPQRGSNFCVHPKDVKISPQEAEAGMVKFFEEKAALADRLCQADPDAEWKILAQTEADLFARTKVLHQRRRNSWRMISLAPLELLAWLKLTVTYAWYRVRLGQQRTRLLARLAARTPIGQSHISTITQPI